MKTENMFEFTILRPRLNLTFIILYFVSSLRKSKSKFAKHSYTLIIINIK